MARPLNSMRRQFTLYYTVYIFWYMATCHDKVYRLKVQQVNTRSLTPLQYNAVPFNRTATYIIFMKLMMSNICSDYTREALIGGCKIIIELNEHICDKVQCHSVQQLKHHKGSIILQGCYISTCRCSWNCVHPSAILATSY